MKKMRDNHITQPKNSIYLAVLALAIVATLQVGCGSKSNAGASAPAAAPVVAPVAPGLSQSCTDCKFTEKKTSFLGRWWNGAVETGFDIYGNTDGTTIRYHGDIEVEGVIRISGLSKLGACSIPDGEYKINKNTAPAQYSGNLGDYYRSTTTLNFEASNGTNVIAMKIEDSYKTNFLISPAGTYTDKAGKKYDYAMFDTTKAFFTTLDGKALPYCYLDHPTQ
jgi:hypothetical protein